MSLERSQAWGRNPAFVRGSSLRLPLGVGLLMIAWHFTVIQQPTNLSSTGSYHLPSRLGDVYGAGPYDYSYTSGRDPIPSRIPDEVCDLLLLLCGGAA